VLVCVLDGGGVVHVGFVFLRLMAMGLLSTGYTLGIIWQATLQRMSSNHQTIK
jgi:hypothetical protein